jgi:hypothetical protein
MRVSRSMRWAVAAAGLTAGLTALVPVIQAQAGAVAASAPAPAAPPTVCGTTPSCAESNDFAVMITNFRTSDLRGYKMLDVVVRFRNKTANPLVLGYVQGSGGAVDEKGNRYSVYGGNGVRGIGQVSGNSFDPKFTLPPGGVGDAQFELAWYPGQQIYGFTFGLDLTVDEINSYEGNQHSLGGEFPLHFEGLTNGISSGTALAAGPMPGVASPCNKVGGVAGTAMSVAGASGDAVSNAAGQAAATAATVSSVASLFHKKKAPAPTSAQSVDPCAAAAPAAAVQSAPTGAIAVVAQPAPPGPVVATATAAGAIASKNPPATNTRPVPTTVKATPVSAATPVAATTAATVTTKTQPGLSPTTAKTQVATTTATTAKTAAVIKTVAAATPAKKDTTAKPAAPIKP